MMHALDVNVTKRPNSMVIGGFATLQPRFRESKQHGAWASTAACVVDFMKGACVQSGNSQRTDVRSRKFRVCDELRAKPPCLGPPRDTSLGMAGLMLPPSESLLCDPAPEPPHRRDQTDARAFFL
jgi:hypothetical protein